MESFVFQWPTSKVGETLLRLFFLNSVWILVWPLRVRDRLAVMSVLGMLQPGFAEVLIYLVIFSAQFCVFVFENIMRGSFYAVSFCMCLSFHCPICVSGWLQ
jgi:hypothetical protein